VNAIEWTSEDSPGPREDEEEEEEEEEEEGVGLEGTLVRARSMEPPGPELGSDEKPVLIKASRGLRKWSMHEWASAAPIRSDRGRDEVM
jgi:hypothetical protein